jgi:hypothetical protein
VLQGSLHFLLSFPGKQWCKRFHERCECKVLFQGDLRPLPDWFELDSAVRVLEHQSGWKMNADTLGLKALIDLHVRHSHHLVILLEERPVPE